jgi:hypothetical protein
VSALGGVSSDALEMAEGGGSGNSSLEAHEDSQRVEGGARAFAVPLPLSPTHRDPFEVGLADIARHVIDVQRDMTSRAIAISVCQAAIARSSTFL